MRCACAVKRMASATQYGTSRYSVMIPGGMLGSRYETEITHILDDFFPGPPFARLSVLHSPSTEQRVTVEFNNAWHQLLIPAVCFAK